MPLCCFFYSVVKPLRSLKITLIPILFSWAVQPVYANSNPLEQDTALQEQSSNAPKELSPMTADEVKQTKEMLEQTLRDLETDIGPMHLEVGKKRYQLGLVYQIEERFDKSLEQFERCLEIIRIHYGLHHEVHIPVIEQVIQMHRLLRNWKDVDRYYKYMEWMFVRVYGENSPKLLPMLNKLILWKVEALNIGLTDNRRGFLSQALHAAQKASYILQQNPHINERDVMVISENDLRQALRQSQRVEQGMF